MIYQIILNIAIASAIMLLLKLYQRFCFCDAHKLPGPPSDFLLSNVKEFGSNNEDSFNGLQRLKKYYGAIVRIWQGPIFLKVIVSDPNFVEQILSSNVHLNKGDGYNSYKPWLGDEGLLTAKGDLWRIQRKLIIPTFHFKILDGFFRIFNRKSNTLLEILMREGAKGPVDVYPFLKLYGLDVICETSMGVNVNTQLNENKEFVMAVEEFLEILMRKYFSVLKHFQWYYRFTEDFNKEQRAIKTLKDFTKAIIWNRIEQRRARDGNVDETDGDADAEFGIKRKTAFLDLLLNLKDDNKLTERELNDNVNTFLFAVRIHSSIKTIILDEYHNRRYDFQGHDTIAATLTFALFHVAKCPAMQRKIVEEIFSVVGRDVNEPITMRHVQEMTYLECFLREVLRYYSPVPFVERKLSSDFKIGDYLLPKDAGVVIFIYGVHHDERYFPHPEKFDPDRFRSENSTDRHPFAFIPFSAGPRNCIGWKFAMFQLKLTFAILLRKLEFSAVVPEHKLRLANDVILKSVNGTPVNVRSRILRTDDE